MPTLTSALPTVKLLCVEDNPDDVELLGIALERADPQRRYELHRADDAITFASVNRVDAEHPEQGQAVGWSSGFTARDVATVKNWHLLP